MMKNFHDYYFGLTKDERDLFVQQCGTTIGYAERLAGGFAKPSFDVLRRIIRVAKGKVDFNSFVHIYEKRNGPVA